MPKNQFWLNGEARDDLVANRLIRKVRPARHMLGEKAYDSGVPREELEERGTKPISAFYERRRSIGQQRM